VKDRQTTDRPRYGEMCMNIACAARTIPPNNNTEQYSNVRTIYRKLTDITQ